MHKISIQPNIIEDVPGACEEKSSPGSCFPKSQPRRSLFWRAVDWVEQRPEAARGNKAHTQLWRKVINELFSALWYDLQIIDKQRD